MLLGSPLQNPTNSHHPPPTHSPAAAMAPPLACGPGALQRRRLQEAAEGNFQLFKRAASALDGGKGRLRDAVEAVKLRGAGALHLATRRGRMPVCVYLVEELHRRDRRALGLPPSSWLYTSGSCNYCWHCGHFPVSS